MKKRILAIVLMLMLAVSLLPATAFASGIDYVSVNGTAFESFGQTIKCGNGTATLKGSESSPKIVLKNAQITKFDNMGTYEGITTYAGIVFIGDSKLEISLEGKNTVTAPSHSSKAVYAGVLTNQATEITGGAIIYQPPKSFLTINGVDIGIETTGDDGSGKTLTLLNSGVDISASQVCIYSGSVVGRYLNLNLTSGGNAAAVCDGAFSMSNKSTANISLSPVLKNYEGTAVGISVSGMVGASLNSTITVSMNADARGFESFALQGIAAGAVSATDTSSITLNLNAKSDKSGATIGIYCDKDLHSSGGSSINANLSFNGEHGQACGIITDNLAYVSDINSTITGAGVDDAALAIMSYIGLDRDAYETVGMIDYFTLETGSIYAAVDNANTQCGAIVHGFDCTNRYGELKIAYPSKGSFGLLEDGEDNAYIVKDAKGNPASAVVITDKDYAFRDIDSSNTAPFKDAILWAVDKGITNGFTPVEFRPSAQCTRGQVVTFLWRAKGCPEPTITENPFVDVASTSPYYKAILWAYENGITTGIDDTHFKPTNPCTRGQVVTFLWRADGTPAPQSDENPFKDVSKTGKTAPFYDAILWAAENGITTGYSDNTFRPSATCTRGQIVTFIYRDMNE